MKKALVIFVAALMCVCMLPFGAFAEEPAAMKDFPELVITEVHLNSIKVKADAGPFNATADWAGKDWWGADHPTESALDGNILQYVEVYNSSDRALNLYDYKLIIDQAAYTADSEVKTLDLKSGNIEGSKKIGNGGVKYYAENPSVAVLAPGETAIIYIYNQNDAELRSTFEAFKGYYEWRYDGDDCPVKPKVTYKTLNLDLSETLIIAVDDTAATSAFGDWANNISNFGIAVDTAPNDDVKANWTSWVFWQTAYWTKNGDPMGAPLPETTCNFLYGLDNTADICEGRRAVEGHTAYDCNPGALNNFQKAALPHPDRVNKATLGITEINNCSGNDYMDYVEVVNIADERINIFDYCFLGKWNISNSYSDGSEYRLAYFDRVNYIIPGNIGNIHSYTSQGSYAGTSLKNVDYEQGWINPGEVALIWEVKNSTYGAADTSIEKFRENYSLGADSKVFMMCAEDNLVSEQGQRIGLSNSNCEIYGFAKLSDFVRETDTERGGDAYAEIMKEDLVYDAGNKTTYVREAYNYNIYSADCFVFMFETMINGTGSGAVLGTNVAYQYSTSYAAEYGIRLCGSLQIAKQNDKGAIKSVPDFANAWKATPGTLIERQTGAWEPLVIESVTVTWDVNGTKTQEVYNYGATPTFKGSTDIAEDENYTYEFKSWSPEIETATGNITYTAKYNRIRKAVVTTAGDTAAITTDAPRVVTSPVTDTESPTAGDSSCEGCGGFAVAAQLIAVICGAAAFIIIKKK